MSKADRSEPDAVRCNTWEEIVQFVESFPAPERTVDAEGGVSSTSWIFRGVGSADHDLQPGIEREVEQKALSWPALELLVSTEFKSRAHLHSGQRVLSSGELTWLAEMQHYGVPTRLLDFTESPFVALYFAVVNGRATGHRGAFRIYAVDANALNNRFRKVAWNAILRERARRKVKPKTRGVSLHPDDFWSDRDSIKHETLGLSELIEGALSATGSRRAEQERQGCVCAALPPTFNARLASQQGVFLVNCAESLSLRESLSKMMAPATDWLRTADVPIKLATEIERRLFQMNIHEQSLFPDLRGLAGLIRQKARLQWT